MAKVNLVMSENKVKLVMVVIKVSLDHRDLLVYKDQKVL